MRSASAQVLAAARAAGFSLLQRQDAAPAGAAAALLLSDDGAALLDASGARVGCCVRVSGAADVAAVAALAGTEPVVLVEPAEDCWRVIPAENLVAAFARSHTRLLVAAATADEARLLLGALETGVDGVVLATDDAAQVAQLQAYVGARQLQGVRLAPATVTRVEAVGMGDRACVDTAAVLLPGEGLLLGCFAGGFFLVLSEALESGYIAARPFRVNAGPVCNYLLADERTAYLSELRAGSTVVLTDAAGNTREEVVGRVKIERRPLVLVEAQDAGGARFAVMLQNAETVRLGTPSGSVSVSELQPGDAVLLALNAPARHGGVAVEEECCEK